jgi:ubiquinone/menaquinone biosynthesis C-methylase UbiE
VDHNVRMTQAFDDLAVGYDHEHHDAVAESLLEFAGAPLNGRAADVACGSGAAALALTRARTSVPSRTQGRPPVEQQGQGADESPRILAIDLSSAMILAGRARALQAGYGDAIDWRVGRAVPLPVADGALDLIVCASSLHFLGASALADWRRALRPGGAPRSRYRWPQPSGLAAPSRCSSRRTFHYRRTSRMHAKWPPSPDSPPPARR